MQRRIGEAFQKLCAAQTVADGGGHRQQEDNARGLTIYVAMGDGRWAMGDGDSQARGVAAVARRPSMQ